MMVQFCYSRLYLEIKTVSFPLFLWMARMDMDETCKNWAIFSQVLMQRPQTSPINYYD